MGGCRPIIGLDGTHLKTSTGGVMLYVVGVDGNNNMYPIAYAVVLKENTKSLKWFVSLLIDDLCIENSFTWSIISDKQKGLLKAIEMLLPNAEHRFCLWHMYNNFKHKRNVMKAASATRLVDFNNEMEKLMASDKAAYQWVNERDPKHWAKSHFNTWPKCDMLLNNFCEAFNSVILKARDKPIITMLETIRVLLMKMLHTQRDKVILKFNGEIFHSIQRILENNKKNAHNYILVWNGHHKFEVEGWIGVKWTVDLGARSCSCRRWDLTGILCVHAISCIFYRRENVEDYVENWYKRDMFLRAYEHLLNPIKSYKEWPSTNLNPIVPWGDIHNKPGRPSKHARRKEVDEIESQKYGIKRHGMKYSCSNCGKRGHNKTSCVDAPMSQETTSTSKSKLSVTF
ncbi:hypothetical protein KSP39_PZI021980 [Platanthera zijinensis]|uniref:SWIM-type domain-containing protein n=1 Tax=Platanthera zijinensis TaxID=2320716 RepID=A0AAP0FVC6_9ASPA